MYWLTLQDSNTNSAITTWNSGRIGITVSRWGRKASEVLGALAKFVEVNPTVWAKLIDTERK